MRARVPILVIVLASISAGSQSIEVPYRGLDYSMLSKDGVTVMIAPLELSIMNYAAAHVWVTNGTSRTIQVAPQLFTARLRTLRNPTPVEVTGASDAQVVAETMRKARFGDVMALVRAYERNLYGFKNAAAVGYYQERKQVAAAEGGSRRIGAAARVSALVLQKTEIPAGEFREGTVFFAAGDKKSEFLGFSTRIGSLTFAFKKEKSN